MLLKTIIILALLAVIFNLFAGLYHMFRDRGQSDKTVRALTRRIVWSVALFALLAIGMYTGIITPHEVAAS